ncbi:MAG: siphovirus Gp157 family protein [Candidatus Thorarchaeota archaeon]
MNEIEEADGELTEAQNTALVINEDQLKQKTISYLEVIKSKEAFNSNVDDEIKRLQAIKKRNNTLIDRLNNSLLDAVKLFGEITCGTMTFTTRKSERLIIEDEELIPQDYRTQKLVISIDKLAIKKAIKNGEEVEGAIIQENQNLKIK